MYNMTVVRKGHKSSLHCLLLYWFVFASPSLGCILVSDVKLAYQIADLFMTSCDERPPALLLCRFLRKVIVSKHPMVKPTEWQLGDIWCIDTFQGSLTCSLNASLYVVLYLCSINLVSDGLSTFRSQFAEAAWAKIYACSQISLDISL